MIKNEKLRTLSAQFIVYCVSTLKILSHLTTIVRMHSVWIDAKLVSFYYLMEFLMDELYTNEQSHIFDVFLWMAGKFYISHFVTQSINDDNKKNRKKNEKSLWLKIEQLVSSADFNWKNPS